MHTTKFLVCTIFICSYVVLGKEKVIYQATGGKLIDLIRGIPPEGAALKLTKVEGDTAVLPDGIYYEPPEDEAFEEREPYLYLHVSFLNTFFII